MKLSEGMKLHGFIIDRIRESEELHGRMVEMTHEKTGAQLVYLDNGEENKLFCASFKTLPEDSTGVFHILEHSVLCGSDKYPVREPFVELLKSSMNTFLNAMTFSDKTIYPVSSRNEQDFMNLTEVYLDAVFAPAILKNPNIFYQEGWHIELDENGQPLYKGVVFNEMKGAMSDVDELIEQKTLDVLFPDNCYGFCSGGDPKNIPDLTYEQFLRMYHRYYHPSNARIYLDGAVPLDRVLTLIDSYLSRFDRLDEAHDIPIQKPFAVQAEQTYEISASESTEGKTMLTLAKIFASWTDRTRIAATAILFDVLMGSNEAPLKKALLSSGKCQDTSSSLGSDIAQPYMMLTMRCIQDGSEDELRQIIRDTVQALRKTGLDKDALTASINRSEYHARRFGEPAGLNRCIFSLNTWLYGGDPMLPLVQNERYAELRRMAEGDGFDRLMEELLLDESTMAVIRTVPSHTCGEALRKDEAERLAKRQASWTDADREALRVQNEKLAAWQQTPDTAEQLATLPMLSVKEISPEPVLIPAVESQVDSVRVITHALPTNGITTLTFYFALTDYTLPELSRLSVAAWLLDSLPTKRHDPLALNQAIKRDIGELMFGIGVMNRDMSKATPVLCVTCSMLNANIDKACALVHEILTETCFDAQENIRTLLTQYNERYKKLVIGMGHMMAKFASSADMSAAAAVNNAVDGLGLIATLKELTEQFDAQYPAFKALCSRFSSDTIAKKRMTLSIASDSDVDVSAILSAYPEGTTVPAESAYTTDMPHRSACCIPAQISYTGMAYDYRLAGKAFDGAAKVAASILSYSYLWNLVRVQGGAYGVWLTINRFGGISASSFRDPSPARTLNVYRTLAKGLREFTEGDEQIDKYIISTVAHSEPLLSLDQQAKQSDMDCMTGVTAEDLRRERAEMLATDAAALLKWCDALDAMANDGGVCVVGFEDALNACADEHLTTL